MQNEDRCGLFWVGLSSSAGLRGVFWMLMGVLGLMAHPGFANTDGADSSLKYFKDLAETRSFSLGAPISATLTPDGKHVLFLRSEPRRPVLRLFEHTVATGQELELLTPEQVLQGTEEQLSPEEKARRERMRVSMRGFTSFQLSKDGVRLLLTLSGRLYVVERATRKVTALPGEGWFDPRFSPDGLKVGGIKGGEVWVVGLESLSMQALTAGATDTLTHGVAEFVAQEEMGRHSGWWWSPDSSAIAFQETDVSGVETLYIANPMRPEVQPEAYRYPRAGTPNARVRLGVVPLTGGDPRWIRWDSEKFPYLARVSWSEVKAPLTLLVQTRAQQDQQLLQADLATGNTSILLSEHDDAWLNLDDQLKFPYWLDGGRQFLWTSEASGFWQLELRDRSGARLRAVTPDGFGYTGLEHVDEGRGEVVFSGGPTATERHIYRVSVKGGVPKALSSGAGFHQLQGSREGTVWLSQKSLLDGTTGAELKDRGGKVLGVLRSVAEAPPALPRLELRRVRIAAEGPGAVEGAITLDAAIIRPASLEIGKKYPVILHVYGGPGAGMVRALPRSYFREQWMADQGYVVISLDGRGTPGRGRVWERATRGNLIELPLTDQARGLVALGAELPELDLERVAVFGWSFGGYFSAMAVMKKPELFKVAAAGAPVVDFADYDTHYTERYLGIPAEAPDAYRACNVLTYATGLKRPLLLIHGLTDDNVYFLHSMKLSQALFMAGKSFELLPMTGTHMVSDPMQTLMLYTRILGFMESGLKRVP